MRIIKDFPFSSNFEKNTDGWRIAGMGRNLGNALLQTDCIGKKIFGCLGTYSGKPEKNRLSNPGNRSVTGFTDGSESSVNPGTAGRSEMNGLSASSTYDRNAHEQPLKKRRKKA
ncbi:hypothetical protein ACFS3C_09345 [Azotobacter vinelandii]